MPEIKKVDVNLIAEVCQGAEKSAKKRAFKILHDSPEEGVQRMLFALQPDTYVHPHKHEVGGQFEFLTVVQGKLGVLAFDEKGAITETHTVGPKGELRAIEIPPNMWHTVVCLENNTTVIEIKPGPYNPGEVKVTAVWAPDEQAPDVVAYLSSLRGRFI
ncbi:MAG: hypothetical protein US96_C0035G0002 [Candidatus Woesebacteria bacterium GW2011_GWB1_38_5b]|uniref:Cupin fold metalloprotein WbuC cupin domain-containing protein n=1 Tax=Candidatus Woesebacteria bacterium GW2011_GWB1_38_5b TaxID=1618569 RepID=A0A0G0K3K5_9BACT|nr:MAG: hypothetical protein US96_C0035G0002 [Candidatus Woesebacteria bacterium GW2011_GWB1_38_5b]